MTDVKPGPLGIPVKTTVAISRDAVGGRLIGHVRCEGSWVHLCEVAEHLTKWLEERSLPYNLVCSASERQWFRAEIGTLDARTAGELLAVWVGLRHYSQAAQAAGIERLEAQLARTNLQVRQLLQQFAVSSSRCRNSHISRRAAAV